MRAPSHGLAADRDNTFSPIPTGLAGFREQHNYYRHEGSKQPGSSCNLPVIDWRRLAERDGHEVAESISASAQPAGLTVRGVYEEMRADIIADLKAALSVDAVLLYMHGAMVADGYDDCEGDVLTQAACRELQEEFFRDPSYAPLGMYEQPTCYNTRITGVPAGFPVFWNVRPA